MNFWQRLIQQPQRIWLRRAMFQIHLWTGIGIGLYVLVICVTGSIVVFRSELSNKLAVKPASVPVQGQRLSDDALTSIAERLYPGFTVSNVFRNRRPDLATEVWMERNDEKKQRSFDPYTGQDLGDAIPPGLRAISWMIDLHDNLLGGDTGRFINGIGGGVLTVLCLTGAVIWWPGIKNWRRSLALHRKVGWKRFNWDLHSAVGFWSFAFVFIWGISGIYLALPNPFNVIVDFLQPLKDDTSEPRLGDDILLWFGRLHFGRFYGMPMKITWAVLGLIPPILFVTGAIMWWNRVLRPIRKARVETAPAGEEQLTGS